MEVRIDFFRFIGVVFKDEDIFSATVAVAYQI